MSPPDRRQRHHHPQYPPSPPPPAAFTAGPAIVFSSSRYDEVAAQQQQHRTREPFDPPHHESFLSSKRRRRKLVKRGVDVALGLCFLSAFVLLSCALRGFVSSFGRPVVYDDGKGGEGNVVASGAGGGARTTTAVWSGAIGRLRGAFAPGRPAWMILPDCGGEGGAAAMEGRGGGALGGLRDVFRSSEPPPSAEELLSRLGSMQDVTSELLLRCSSGDDEGGQGASAEEDVTFFFWDATSSGIGGTGGGGDDVREVFEKCHGNLVRVDGVKLTDIRTLPTVAERRAAAAAAAVRSAEDEAAGTEGADEAPAPPTVNGPAELAERQRAESVKRAMMDPTRQSKLESLGKKAATDNLAWYEKNHRHRRRRLQQAMTQEEAPPIPDVVMSDELRETIAAFDARLLSSSTEEKRRAVRTFALVEHPLRRSLSEYRILISSSPEHSKMTIVDAVKANLLRTDPLTRSILAGVIHDDEKLTRRHVEIASIVLWTKALVGLSSQLGESWDRASVVLGFPRGNGEVECGRNLLWARGQERERSAEDRVADALDALSRKDRRALTTINRYDLMLYENVERMFAEQGKLLGRNG